MDYCARIRVFVFLVSMDLMWYVCCYVLCMVRLGLLGRLGISGVMCMQSEIQDMHVHYITYVGTRMCMCV